MALLKANSNCIGTKGKGQSKQKHLKVTQSDKKKKQPGQNIIKIWFYTSENSCAWKEVFCCTGTLAEFSSFFPKVKFPFLYPERKLT